MAQERHGAAHRVKSWKRSESWSPQGNIVATSKVGDDPYGHHLKLIQNSKTPGFSVGLDFTSQVGPSGISTEQFSAGPFKTQRRAEIAGPALVERAEAGKASNYQTGSDFTSADEMKAERHR